MIAAPGRPALVVAGAGAGKTETMAARVVWLVATGAVLPEQVLGLTFTRKAAQQLGARVRSRLRRLAGSRILDELDPSGARQAAAARGRADRRHLPRLRRSARRRARPAAARRARRAAARGDRVVAARAPGGEHVGGRARRRRAARHRHELAAGARRESSASTSSRPRPCARTPNGCPRRLQAAPAGQGPARRAVADLPPLDRDAARRVALLPLVEAFAARKRAERAVDFADQLAIAARVADAHPEVGAAERAIYRAVLLDEYQDTGHAQRVLLRALFGTRPGDPVRPGRADGHGRRRPVLSRSTAGAGPARATSRDSAPTSPPTTAPRTSSACSRASATRQGCCVWPTPRRRRCARPASMSGSCDRPRTPRRATCGWGCCPMSPPRSPGWPTRSPSSGAVTGRRPRRPCSCVAVSTWTRSPRRCGPAACPSRSSASVGCWIRRRSRDLVSALRLVADPLAGPAAVRLLTGARVAAGGRGPRRAVGARP